MFRAKRGPSKRFERMPPVGAPLTRRINNHMEEQKPIKKFQISFSADGKMQFPNVEVQVSSALDDAQKKMIQQVVFTVKAYLDAAEKLLQGQYTHLRDYAPVHLSNPGNVLVACCSEGVVIRYDIRNDKRRIAGAWYSESFTQLLPLLSQNIIHCYPDKSYTSTVPTTGMEIKLSKTDPNKLITEDIASVRIGFDVVIERPDNLPKPPNKPFCLLSVRNLFEFGLEGVLAREDAKSDEGQKFITRTVYRLPVGWECIEVYAFFEPDDWRPEYASIWADHDILATVVAHNSREAQFQSLDPTAAARRAFAALLKSYKDLLDSNPDREEILQSFLRDHPALLCPAHIGIWPKLKLGAHVTDFVFREAAGDYLLVELEPSRDRLFLKDGHASAELNHAKGQITDWKRYLEDNLQTVQHELGLTGISSNPKSLVVIGRSNSLTDENRRKLVAMESESPRVKIMTYDDIYDNAKAVIENLLGPIWDVSGNTEIYYPRDGLQFK